ncbi:CD1375 family protein [Ruminiclostridium josui]|nr:CD1375 family protein [Ruminiclostridium josui]
MLEVYITLIKNGVRELDSIPEKFRAEVKKKLEQDNIVDTSK